MTSESYIRQSFSDIVDMHVISDVWFPTGRRMAKLDVVMKLQEMAQNAMGWDTEWKILRCFDILELWH